MTWQLLIIIYLVLTSVSYLLRRTLAVRLPEHNRLINGFFFLCILFPTGLILGLLMSPNFDIGLFNYSMLLIGSASFAIINLAVFRASKYVDAGSLSLIHNIFPIVTILTAALLLGERLNHNQFIGVAIIILSALIVTIPSFKYRFITKTSGLLLALFAVTLLGFAAVYERWMLTRIDFGAYLVIAWGFQAMWMTIAAWPERKNLKILKNKQNFLPILGYGISNTFKGLCFIGALALSGSASIPAASSSFTAVIVVLASYFVLKEKKRLWLKILAAIIGAVGLIILTTA